MEPIEVPQKTTQNFIEQQPTTEPGQQRDKKIRMSKKVTDNFSLDEEPLTKLKKYVLRQKLAGVKTSTSSIINELIKNKVRELEL